MGNRLVEELELNDRADTLSKWMAHYLAELIVQSKNSQDPAKRAEAENKCSEVIMSLWNHRAGLPGSARPLSDLEPILVAIRSLINNDEPWIHFATRTADESSNLWCDFIKQSYCADRRMAYIATVAAIAESKFDREKRWLDENKEMLSEEEKEIIELLDVWLNSELDWQTRQKRASVRGLNPKERTELILKELEASVLRQKQAVNKLKKRISAKKSAAARKKRPAKRSRKR